jgi:ribonuclease HII
MVRGAEGVRDVEALVDGLFVPNIPVPAKPLVKADSLIPEVMAASILAKTARDRMMERYGWIYPEYGYEKHKGYPTKAHRALIAQYGPSPIQRLSFRVSVSL